MLLTADHKKSTGLFVNRKQPQIHLTLSSQGYSKFMLAGIDASEKTHLQSPVSPRIAYSGYLQ